MNHLLALGAFALIANEIRGLVMAGPVLAAMYVTGPSWAKVLTLLCIAVSVLVPVWAFRKWSK